MSGLDKIDVVFTFRQNEYRRAVQQYLLAGNIVRKRDFFILPLIFLFLFTALIYSHFNKWVLLLNLVCLAVILLLCYLFFIKPWHDYNRKPQLHSKTLLSFTEEGIIWPAVELYSLAEDESGPKFTNDWGSYHGEPAPSEAPIIPGSEEPQTPVSEEAEPAVEEDPDSEMDTKRLTGNMPAFNKPAITYAESAAYAPKTREKRLRWNMIAEAWENREFFFLIQQSHKYHIVPKHSFASQEEMQYFLRILYRRVGIVEVVAPYPSER